jgi:ketosteroid isomerase-like protein
MSQENMEIVRRAIDAYNRGQEALDLFDPEIEWVTTGRFVEPDTYQGHEEVQRYLQALRDDFEELHVGPHELVDAGDHVIARVRFTGRGRLSSAPIDLKFTFVFSLRGGKIIRVRNYWEQTDALEAVGCGSRRWRSGAPLVLGRRRQRPRGLRIPRAGGMDAVRQRLQPSLPRLNLSFARIAPRAPCFGV